MYSRICNVFTNFLKATDKYIANITQLNIQQLCIFPTECIYGFNKSYLYQSYCENTSGGVVSESQLDGATYIFGTAGCSRRGWLQI